MVRISYGLAPAMFLISGFAATQANAATVLQTFNTPFPTTGMTNITIGASSTAQYALTSSSIQALGTSSIGAKNSGMFPTTSSTFGATTGVYFGDPTDYQLKFEINGEQNYGLARFGSVGGANGLQSVEYGPTLAGAVPEPEAWAMMIVGLGVVGASLRASRRRGAVALAA